MINGVGVMGWGVGGIEAEAVMLGQPYYMAIPEVIGVRMTGRLREGVTATDLVLTVTEMLRKRGVVEKFVEYFGPGMKSLSVPDRATIANMTPEYGATLGFFPVDEKTIDYLRMTNRTAQRRRGREDLQGARPLLHRRRKRPNTPRSCNSTWAPSSPCVAGPARPQDRIRLAGAPGDLHESARLRPTNATPTHAPHDLPPGVRLRRRRARGVPAEEEDLRRWC